MFVFSKRLSLFCTLALCFVGFIAFASPKKKMVEGASMKIEGVSSSTCGKQLVNCMSPVLKNIEANVKKCKKEQSSDVNDAKSSTSLDICRVAANMRENKGLVKCGNVYTLCKKASKENSL